VAEGDGFGKISVLSAIVSIWSIFIFNDSNFARARWRESGPKGNRRKFSFPTPRPFPSTTPESSLLP
jgi:hypothetical protein